MLSKCGIACEVRAQDHMLSRLRNRHVKPVDGCAKQAVDCKVVGVYVFAVGGDLSTEAITI